MKKITERYCESLPKKEQMWKDTLGAVEAIDPTKDSNFLICAFKTGDKLPADFCFSDTQLEITKKLLLLPTAATPEESLEYLSSLPAKQGKKRALEKLKIIEKEIIELGKHKQSIDMLQLEFAKFPNADHALEELAEHTDQMKAKLDTLFVKKHSYDVYLAQLDDKPAPQSPALFQSQKTADNAVANAVDLLAKSPADSACSPSSPPNHHQQDSQGTGSAHHSSVSKDPQPPSKTQSETKIGALPAIGSDPTELSALFDKGEEMVVLYDFEAAENSDEISIPAGEKVEVVCVRDDGCMEIVYVYQKKRSEFGKQALLSDRPAEVSLAIQPDPAYMKNYVERNPSHTEVQATPDKSEHEVNTESYVVNSCGILHTQGGWPKDVDATDVEHTIRFRKKIEKDEEYMRVIKNLGESMEHTIKQNNAIDIYQEYFPDSGDSASSDAPSAKSLNVYRDPNSIKRAATYLSWYPEEGHKIAVAYSVLQFQGMPANMSLDSYIWDVENPNAPDQTLTPTSPLVCIKYNPKDPHILVGGSYNGLLSYWDTRKGAFPVDTSPQEKSHRDPVYNVAWVQSKSGI
ncbi:Dynein intermediate chain 2, axonemal [Kappamyces sp. JEL0680]|nr:Dynein intermediate chain 2, axonemal [Kappamyces sp. JEL0680]